MCTQGHRELKELYHFFKAHGKLNMDFFGSYFQVFMTRAGLTSVANSNKLNTESLDLDMTSMLVKINLYAHFHMFIFLPPHNTPMSE